MMPSQSNTDISESSAGLVNDTIERCKHALETAHAAHSDGKTLLTIDECNGVIVQALGMPMPWSDVVQIATAGQATEGETVDFVAFLRNYEEFVRSQGNVSFEGAHLYKQLKLLQVACATVGALECAAPGGVCLL